MEDGQRDEQRQVEDDVAEDLELDEKRADDVRGGFVYKLKAADS